MPRNYKFINPILHTALLENHALTLKSNTAKYHLVKVCPELRKIKAKKYFTFYALSV